MKITNLSQSTLTLPTGEVLAKGASVDVKEFDEKHHVVAAWLDAGLIEKPMLAPLQNLKQIRHNYGLGII